MPKKLIISVDVGGVGEALGVEQGDFLLSVNGRDIRDVFDYRYETANEYVELEIEKKNGEIWALSAEKDEYEDMGLVFETGLMDEPKPCSNKCVFCFVDQLPHGMRETLYFKDDDFRLSFLTGNYVTLTNVPDAELERLINYRLSPVNVSVHAVSPEIRTQLLGNKRAGNILKQLQKLKNAGISLNFQIVLCKGINDGAVLAETVEALAGFIPEGRSLSVVPVGLTRRRAGLFGLEPFTQEDAREVITFVHEMQDIFLAEYGTRFVYAADEFYLTAGVKIPPYKSYEDFPQIENGVGMAASFMREATAALAKAKDFSASGHVTVVTGTAAYGMIKRLSKKIEKKAPHLKIETVPVKNSFFGETVTVSGLLTGHDIINTLEGRNLGSFVFLPRNALRAGEDVFLDDIALPDMEKALGTRVMAVPASGFDFVNTLLSQGEAFNG